MVTISPEQRATISPEAVQILSKIPTVPFAGILSPYLASSRRAKSLRNDMSTKTNPHEEELIAKYKLKVTKTSIAAVSVVIIEPPVLSTGLESKILFNFYGGGFVMGSARDRAALLMAAEIRMRVYSVEYSKAPEARYPIARDEALTVYREPVSQFGANNICCMGSSAGAQILVSALLVAHEEGLAMPAWIYLCAPALDLSGAGDSMVSNGGRDLMPATFFSAMVKQNYQPDGMDLMDPLYSPIYADYDSFFPPTVISVGTRDLCLSNGVRMYWKLRETGVKVELLVSEGMWHGFNWNDSLPEAIQLRQVIREFMISYV